MLIAQGYKVNNTDIVIVQTEEQQVRAYLKTLFDSRRNYEAMLQRCPALGNELGYPAKIEELNGRISAFSARLAILKNEPVAAGC